jgi:hypothetical protein
MGIQPETPTEHSPLTPLASRLCDALESIGDTVPQAAMVVMAVRKSMLKNPVSDDEISAALMWVEEMIRSILVGPELYADGEMEDL